VAVSYTVKGDAFLADRPRVWASSSVALASISVIGTYDPAPDGKQVAGIIPAGGAQAAPPMTLLLNFFDEVRRRTRE
jgi:hypothetical protein